MKRVLVGRPMFWLVITAILLVGLWPRERAPENRVGWRTPGPGLRCEAPSQCIAERPLWTETGSMTIELWLAPERPEGPGNAEIISLLDGPGVHRLLVGQFQEGLIFRGERDNPDGDPKLDRYLDTKAVEAVRHLAVTIDASGARLHADGLPTGLVLPETRAQPGVAFGGRILLGSSDSHWAEWTGSVFALAVHRRVLGEQELARHAGFGFAAVVPPMLPDLAAWGDPASLAALYVFEQTPGAGIASRVSDAPPLLMPRRLERPTRSTLFTGLSRPGWTASDIAINVLGFVPLGFVVASRRRRRAVWWALSVGLALSLAIEVAQMGIPGRDSSSVDAACNGVGALLGGWLAVWVRRRS